MKLTQKEKDKRALEQERFRASSEFAAHRFAIYESYRALVESLVLLGDAIIEDSVSNLPCWVQTTEHEELLSHEDRAIRILQLLTYGKRDYGMDGRRAETRFGFVAASARTLVKVDVVNAAKEALKTAIKELKEFVSENNKLKAEQEIEHATNDVMKDLKRAPIIKEMLAVAKIPRLHLKQSTRKIVVLDEQPLRLGFTVSRGSHAVRKRSRAQALDVATTWHNKQAEDLLNEMPADIKIAQYQQMSKHVRCNIIYQDRQKVELRPDQVMAYMPIFYPFDETTPPIKHNGVRTELNAGIEDEEDRLPRQSTHVDLSRPISPALGLYHYLT